MAGTTDKMGTDSSTTTPAHAEASPAASAQAPTPSEALNGSAAPAVSSAVAAASDTQAPAAEAAQENEDEDEEVVTLHEVLQEQSELNDAAEAVLGDASDVNCSYELGYYRQALYACLTCTPGPLEGGGVAGVCLACSYHCHGDHELVELYTKRDFRCDCGNSRFPEQSKCVLETEKAPINERNEYSQNFVGTYCNCHRPYPDPERTTPEVMVQCIVCEDWLHDEHIFPSGNAASHEMPPGFDELICMACMEKHAFLMAYQLLEKQDEEELEVEQGKCVLETLQARATEEETAVRPTFWSVEWRTRLCSCSKCVARMEREQIAFLMDPEDSLQAYEARTKQQQLERQQAQASSTTNGGAASTNGAGEDAVVSATVESAMSTMEQAAQRAFQSKLSHEQQVEMAAGYNHMKEKLQTYLATFAASGKTVRAQDIQEFFTELRESKRQRTE